jgi:hypothetical protein
MMGIENAGFAMRVEMFCVVCDWVDARVWMGLLMRGTWREM